MDPSEETELCLERISSECAYEADKSQCVKAERDEAVMSDKRHKMGVDKNDVLEVVDDHFAVEEIIENGKEIPCAVRQDDINKIVRAAMGEKTCMIREYRTSSIRFFSLAAM